MLKKKNNYEKLMDYINKEIEETEKKLYDCIDEIEEFEQAGKSTAQLTTIGGKMSLKLQILRDVKSHA